MSVQIYVVAIALLVVCAPLVLVASAEKVQHDRAPRAHAHNPGVKRTGYMPDPLPEDPDRVILHIVAHTHDDVGWLKTVDEYYLGANQSIQSAGVQYILDSVMPALLLNQDRRFIYVEIAFFERWWHEQSDSMKEVVRNLVSSGRLEFINGGWCMNDEAATTYEAVVDQMTQGHRFLFKEFGIRPTIGWHIDPFGHQNTQASLFAQMGFNGFMFSRIQYKDKDDRRANKTLEMVWQGSQSLGKQSDIFTTVTYGPYDYPGGFAFEWGDAPVNNDPRIFNLNVKQRAEDLVKYARDTVKSFRTPNVLFTFGSDFQFENANVNFKNMDKLVEYIRNHPEYKVDVFYSTPSIYLDYVHTYSEKNNIQWTLNKYDFMPYADCPWCYWTGYFTSRAALKGYVRSRANVLHGAERLLTVSQGLLGSKQITTENLAKIDRLSQAFSIAQHHDAVAGTEKQHVAYDYAERLSIGTAWTQEVVNDVVSSILATGSKATPPKFSVCQKLNESICDAIQGVKQQPIPFVVYNPLAWTRTEWFRLPVPIPNVQVTGPNGRAIPVQIQPNADKSGTYDVVFSLVLAPLSVSSYVLEVARSTTPISVPKRVTSDVASVVISNENYSLTFDSASGLMTNILNKNLGATLVGTQQLVWYNASSGNNKNSSQASGAYIFRPNGTETFNITFNNVPTLSVVQGPLYSEVRQYWTPWAWQTVRLYQGSQYIEYQYTIGPIPIADGLGKELITRWDTQLLTASQFYTDSQGQEMQHRIRNFVPTYKYNDTEPIAANYYPINTAAYIEDPFTLRLTVVTDRSNGGSSIKDGSLEVMIQRRLLHDDGRGVGEALNESDIIRVTHRVVVDRPSLSSSKQRTNQLLANNPPTLLFANNFSGSSSVWFQLFNVTYAGVTAALPPNVHLQTLRVLENGEEVLLRLNHIYGISEDSVLSQPVQVDVGALFTGLSVVEMTEMNLSANMRLDEMDRYTWNTQSSTSSAYKTDIAPLHDLEAGPTVVTLSPMQIRTFIVRFQAL